MLKLDISRSIYRQARSLTGFLCVSLLLLASPSASAQERCGVAKDFVVQALEQIKTGSAEEVEGGLQLLKHANEQCAGLGDAWYYRSLFERRQGQGAKAAYSLSKAKMFGSEAMDQGLDPFLIVTAPARVTTPPGPVHEKWALVIGISKFSDQHVPRLNYSAKDAKDFADLLLDQKIGRFKPDHVRLLLDDQASTRAIKAGLNWLARSAHPDDLAVVFLSSHGSAREKDIVGVNYIITSDTMLGDPEKDPDALFSTALPMVDLTNIVRGRFEARRTAIFLDTCHSGAAASSSGQADTGLVDSSASASALDHIRQGTGRVIITSSTEKERSWESSTFHNGYFTYYLIQAVKQHSGLDPIDKVYAFIRDNVSARVSAEVRAHQTPVLSRSESGTEIVIGVVPAP